MSSLCHIDTSPKYACEIRLSFVWFIQWESPSHAHHQLIDANKSKPVTEVMSSSRKRSLWHQLSCQSTKCLENGFYVCGPWPNAQINSIIWYGIVATWKRSASPQNANKQCTRTDAKKREESRHGTIKEERKTLSTEKYIFRRVETNKKKTNQWNAFEVFFSFFLHFCKVIACGIRRGADEMIKSAIRSFQLALSEFVGPTV